MTLYAFNATIGTDEASEHLPPGEWGWHAYQASSRYLSLEFAQSGYQHVYQPIDDGQVRAGAWMIARQRTSWRRRGVLLPLRLRSHAELEREGETVFTSGKTDPFPYGDPRMGDLRRRLLARLAEIGEQ